MSNYWHSILEKIFLTVTAFPRLMILIGIAVIIATGSFIPGITKDTSAESFLSPDEPTLIYRNKIKEQFGLKDPMVIAVFRESATGVFNPDTLQLVSWLTDEVAAMPGIDPETITSLATEDNIVASDDGMLIESFFDHHPLSLDEVDSIRENVMDLPLYVGNLVAKDASATLIIAEVIDEKNADDIYEGLMRLVDRAPINAGETIHVAGPGAVSGYLSSYIDKDAMVLFPVTGVLVTLVIFLAYLSWRFVMLSTLILLGTVAVALGTMVGMGVPFYVISNALPVALVAIAVADSIHIMGQYYQEQEKNPAATQQRLVVDTMLNMWRPVTFTSLTTIAGFLGIYFSSLMPPMEAIGLYCAIGVAAALFYSLFVFPAGLMILQPRRKRASTKLSENNSAGSDWMSRRLASLGIFVARKSALILGVAASFTVLAVGAALFLKVDEAWISNFKEKEPIYIADTAINAKMDGTYYLDIVVEAPEIDGLLEPSALENIALLQEFLESSANIQGSTSIVDYIKQMNKSINGGDESAYVIPNNSDLIAQYFLLYSASGSPTEFNDKVDYDYRVAVVRANLNTGYYSDNKEVVEKIKRYITTEFESNSELKATMSGQVTVNNEWISELAASHFQGLALALFAIWVIASVSFRSTVAGLYTVLPVGLSVLLVYAVMAMSGIWLGVGTSMFAAIAVGVGVDFGIHIVDRLKILLQDQQLSFEQAFLKLFSHTGRALFFNFVALFLGFGALMVSEVPPLNRFGILVAVAVLTSFVAAMLIIPAMAKVFRPKFLSAEEKPKKLVATDA